MRVAHEMASRQATDESPVYTEARGAAANRLPRQFAALSACAAGWSSTWEGAALAMRPGAPAGVAGEEAG